VYRGILYIADSSNAEYFDPYTNVWTQWPSYPTAIQSDACITLWQNSFLLIDPVNLQSFNLATQSWTSVQISPPSPINNPACISLPNKKVLIVGSSGLPLLFDPAINAWKTLPPTINSQGKVTLLQLGQKYFIFGGNSTETVAQEFNYLYDTWSPVIGGPIPTTNSQGFASGVAVPADFFTKLPNGCTGGFLGRKQEKRITLK
jgi:hypothetical protein